MLRPALVKSVDWVKCNYESPYGKIVSNWKIDGDRFKWEVTIPVNSTATICIPGKDVKVDGMKASKSEDISFLRFEDNYSVFEIGSGKYSFVSSPESFSFKAQ